MRAVSLGWLKVILIVPIFLDCFDQQVIFRNQLKEAIREE